MVVIGQLQVRGHSGAHLLSLDEPITNESLQMARDELRRLLGDENAKVAMSANMGESDYGTGYGVHVTVTLTCDQSVEKVEEAMEVAKGIALEQLQISFAEAQEMFEDTELLKDES